MFKKVLIAEDYESFNISVQKVVEDLKITETKFDNYCDEALSRLKMAIQENEPFELLITDISFDADHRKQTLTNGQELVAAAREIQPDLKVIVFSVEKRQEIIDRLFNDQQINGYVKKGREDVKDLKKAIKIVYKNERFISYDLKNPVKDRNSFEFSTLDTLLISLLAKGVIVKNIPDYLKQNNITPSSMSYVEKKLASIRESLDVNSNEHLIAVCKDFGII